MTRQSALKALGSLPLLALSACVMAETPPPVLVLDVGDGKICVEAPELVGARELAIANNKPVTVNVDADTPCLESSGGERSAYAVFGLPTSMEEYLVSVTSVPQGQTLLSPRVMILDDTGKIMREVPNDSFTFRGLGLAVALRMRTGERYLVVASDPKSIGQEVSRISSATMSTLAPVGYAYVPINTGSETEISHVYAHNGSITVAATPMPKTN